jgi:hypothetical protein
VKDVPLPPNFIETLPETIREDIMSKGSAQERMKRLAELVPDRPIPRDALRFVSLNKEDFMRRIRADSRLPTPPLGDYVCLSWKFRKALLARLGIKLEKNEFVFVKSSSVDVT